MPHVAAGSYLTVSLAPGKIPPHNHALLLHRYIEYESKLEELRKHRRQALDLKDKKTLADYALVRRIHFIFERAMRKFKGDLSLWTRWLEFCRSSSSAKQLSKVVTKAVQVHPTAAGLWVYAAAW